MNPIAGIRRTTLPTIRVISRTYANKAAKPTATPKIATNTEPFSQLPPILHQLHEAKARKGMTFEKLAKELGRNEIFVASIFYGHAKPTAEDIKGLSKALEVDEHSITEELGPHWWPNRGFGGDIPADPVIYRLYEGVIVYGHPIKSVIHEKFGDGIMSMIDCKVNVDRKADPKGDRVVITFDGKFLPYSQN